jgi:leucyl aminopeptidase
MKIKNVKIEKFTTIVEFVFKDDNPVIRDFQSESGEIAIRYEGNLTKIYCGLGEKISCLPSTVRTTTAKAIQKASELKRTEISVRFSRITESKEFQIASVEGIILGAYRFSLYKSDKPESVENIELAGCSLSSSLIRNTEIICQSVNYSRDLVNENASIVTPERLAQEARSLVKNGIKVTVLDEKELDSQGLNLLKAVGQASPTPSRLVIMEYIGNNRSKQKIAIAGKGVTFDSGGQNLKPTGSIETMREDMSGAAAVLGIMRSLSIIKPSLNVIGVIGAAHNAIGSRAYFPGDIYRAFNGKTVEIGSTDAEGRLVLADSIAYCIKKFAPSCIIDIATLTGGILTALGEITAGLFSNNDQLAQELFTSGEETWERLWRFPLYKEYCDSLKSDIADLKNISKFKKGYASAITGAAFIKEFVGDIPWAHLDIAGTSFNEGQSRGEIPQFGTGFGVRLILNYLLKKV